VIDATPFVATALAAGTIVVVGVLVVFAAIILFKVATDKIDISGLLLSDSESASLSRFQFLIFTFVIGFGYLMILCYEILHNGTPPPKPPRRPPMPRP
jgi:hypothetical protein